MDISPELQALIDALRCEIRALKQEVSSLRQENAALRRQLGQDSTNSSKPPSSDGLKKKPRILGSLRGRSGKPSGGQKGHKGDTLRRVEQPDILETHTASKCTHCNKELTEAMVTDTSLRQVFDIPEPRVAVTEHRALIYACAHCHGTTKAAFPEGVTSPVQYGERIKAAAIYLNAFHFIPEDRTAEAMGDLFGAKGLCPASIVGWGVAKAEELKPFVDHVVERAATAPVRHLDETGFRIGSKTQWLHTISTPTLTSYHVPEKRGALPRDLQGGVIVHDHFKPYYRLTGVDHALCNAHHLRELKALIEGEKEPWAKKMDRLLRMANNIVRRAIEKGATSLPEDLMGRIVGLYDTIVAKGLDFHKGLPSRESWMNMRRKIARRPGHNLLIRLRDFKGDVLRFLRDFTVPFTNNLAEQALRMMKVKMKISGGFRTQAGAETFVDMRSVIATARKQSWNILKTLTETPNALVQNLKPD